MMEVNTNRPIITMDQWQNDEYEYASGKKEARATKRATRKGTRDQKLARITQKIQARRAKRKLKRSERKRRMAETKAKAIAFWQKQFGTKATRKAKRSARRLDPIEGGTGDPNKKDELKFQYDIPVLTTKPLSPIDNTVPQPEIVPGTMYKNTPSGSVPVDPSRIMTIMMDAMGKAMQIDKTDVGNKEVVMDEDQPVVEFDQSEVQLGTMPDGTQEFVPQADLSAGETGETPEGEGGWKSLSKGKKTAIVIVGVVALAFMGYAIYKSTKQNN